MQAPPSHSGTLFLVGLGPGSPGLLTPDAAAALEAADTVVGYRGYLDLIADHLDGKSIVGRELGEEVERARTALELAESGRTVALVSSGDAGVYGMGGVAWELAAGRETAAEIVVVPGITAACSAAARLGAPLAHDWACVSLSDLLTPWDTIVRRVEAAAEADFVLVFYNPASRKRTQQLTEIADRLLRFRAPSTPVGLVENAYRTGERVEVVELLDLALGRAHVSMFTTVVVGSTRTFLARGRMVTPRIYAAKSSEIPSDGREAGEPRAPSPGDRIMAESMEIIEREMGPNPADPRERAVVRRMIHASGDFEYVDTVRTSPGAVPFTLEKFLWRHLHSERIPVVTDVEMLRAGIRIPAEYQAQFPTVCFLNDPEAARLAVREGLTRSAAGIRLAAERIGSEAIYAVGNAPTALEELLRLGSGPKGFRPWCIIGLPVGFVGVEAAKRRLRESDQRFITNVGRKGGTAVTAAAVNALFDLAQDSEARRTIVEFG